MRNTLKAMTLVACLTGWAGHAAAEPTDIIVRVLSLGAKFIGTSMGGAEITLRDVQSGEVLAKGVTSGGTGDTKKIMTGGPRNQSIADDSTAMFQARIDITEPRLIEVEALGPMSQPQARVRVSAQQWVVPGAHITQGDGWVLEMPGLVVDALESPADFKPARDMKVMPVAVNITMMCGCPITQGGLWDSARFDVRAYVTHDGKGAGKVPLTFTGTTSKFAGEVPVSGAGNYAVIVAATDRQTGATGIDRLSFMVP